MKHFIRQLRGKDPDPFHIGDTKSWFMYYKWHPDEDDEVFFPIGENEWPDISPGDMVWFTMDNALIGGATILRVEQDDMNDRKELWYNTQKCTVAEESDRTISVARPDLPLEPLVFGMLLEMCRRDTCPSNLMP